MVGAEPFSIALMIAPPSRAKTPAKFDRQACNSGETFLLYTFNCGNLEDNMKSSAPVAVVGVLGCIPQVMPRYWAR